MLECLVKLVPFATYIIAAINSLFSYFWLDKNRETSLLDFAVVENSVTKHGLRRHLP